MKYLIRISFLLLIAISESVYSQQSNLTNSTVTDIDGNVYPVVQIGNQIWMAANLRVTHYNDGTSLTNGTGLGAIDTYPNVDTTRYYFYYNDNLSYASQYGCLYTWFAATNQTSAPSEETECEGICPEGWHIPTDKDWMELEVFLGMDSAAAYSSSCWEPDRPNNLGILLKAGGSTGFNAKYAGVRDYDGSFAGMGGSGFFITSFGEDRINQTVNTLTRLYSVWNNSTALLCNYHPTTAGYSVRCIKNRTSTEVSIKNKPEVPKDFMLYQNHPNPFNPVTNIHYSVPRAGQVTLDIYNLLGQKLETLMDEYQTEGEHQLQWKPEDLPSGIYLARLRAGSQTKTMKLIVQK